MANPNKIKIKITAPVAVKFKLSYEVGDVVSLAPALAKELLDAKCAEKYQAKPKRTNVKK